VIAPILSSILRIDRQRRLALRCKLQPYGFVGVMHLILLRAYRSPGTSQEEVARFYAIDKGSVARDALRLERMGCLRREIDPDDRRQYRLFSTPEGDRILPEIWENDEAFFRRISQGFSQAELEALAAMLKRMEDNSCRKPDAPKGPAWEEKA